MRAFEAGTQESDLANNTRIKGSKLTAVGNLSQLLNLLLQYTIINYPNYLFCSAAGLRTDGALLPSSMHIRPDTPPKYVPTVAFHFFPFIPVHPAVLFLRVFNLKFSRCFFVLCLVSSSTPPCSLVRHEKYFQCTQHRHAHQCRCYACARGIARYRMRR
jgi:hypothetical protein